MREWSHGEHSAIRVSTWLKGKLERACERNNNCEYIDLLLKTSAQNVFRKNLRVGVVRRLPP